MKKRYHLFIVIGVLLALFVVGSFFDLQIDETLFMENNGFGLFMASFGVYPCYFCLSFIGGGLLSTTLRRKEMPIWLKIISYFLSAVAYGLSIFLCAREMPSVNGYNNSKLTLLSYGLSAVCFSGTFVLGFFTCRKGDAARLWKICMILGLAFAFALLPPGYFIKLIIHRPRYRYAVRYEETAFYNWWQAFPEYKNYIGKELVDYGVILTKEEFKSFPSGHSGAGMILALSLPYIPAFFPKLRINKVVLYYAGVAFGALMMFSRLIVGAHYLTDVCAGSMFVMIVYYIANEIALRNGLLDEPKAEEKASLQE